MFWVFSVSYCLVTFIYVWAIFKMKRSFDNMSMINLKSEQRSVYLQFFVFAVAFIFRMLYYFAEASTTQANVTKEIGNFRLCLIESAGFLIVNIIPISYQL